jgi:hypothetical protein
LHAVAATFALGDLTFSALAWRSNRRPFPHVVAPLLMAGAMIDLGVLGILNSVGWAAVLIGGAMLIAGVGRVTPSTGPRDGRAGLDHLELSLGMIAMAIIPLAASPFAGAGVHEHAGMTAVPAVLLGAVLIALVVAMVRRPLGAAPSPSLRSGSRACMVCSLAAMTISALVA